MPRQLSGPMWAGIFTLLLLSVITLPAAAGMPQPNIAPLQKTAKYVYINSEKYQLLARHQDHWSLYDLNTSQPVQLMNKLTVTGMVSLADLTKHIALNKKISVEQIASDVLVFSGPVTLLMQLQQQLRGIVGVKSEWQLRYLPVKSAADR